MADLHLTYIHMFWGTVTNDDDNYKMVETFVYICKFLWLVKYKIYGTNIYT